MNSLPDILAVYAGSNGEATKALYVRLEALGPAGHVAVNLFRACKCSERAKLYRGGGYRGDAYARKQWALDNLDTALIARAPDLGLAWGWQVDPAQPFHNQVLYVELPTGQVSFHTAARGQGPDYTGDWDGVRNQAPTRICRWIADLVKDGATDDA